MTADIFTALAAPFPREQVSWRAQSMNKEGDSAMALAYIDARDVMYRLDEAVGPANWQDAYTETASGRVLCTLSLRIDGHWIAKTDGAGATDVEADKGGISDAFKRAAVKWGIGRYLYDLKSPWVPCESRDSGGKKYWKAWKVDPWTKVRGGPEPVAPAAPANNLPSVDPADFALRWDRMLAQCETLQALQKLKNDTAAERAAVKAADTEMNKRVNDAYKARQQALMAANITQAG